MPDAPYKPCKRCGKLFKGLGPYCEEHRKQKLKEEDSRRLSANERGYDTGWRKVRMRKVQENPMCERCESKGILKPTDLVHHKDRNPKHNEMDNLESLCRGCHDIEHQVDRFHR